MDYEKYLQTEAYHKLDSVGSVIDDKGMVYPMMKNGKPDTGSGTHINDVDPEWLKSLDSKDKKTVSRIKK